jgi:hypothetical protein
MKKEYIIPRTKTVHLNLKGSIMESFPTYSGHTGRQGAKGNSNFEDEDDDEGDDNNSLPNYNAWE